MKKISTFFLFTIICVASYAQEGNQRKVNSGEQPKTVVANSREVTKNANGTSTTISVRAGESQVTHNSAYYQNEIAKIDAQISAISSKIAYVNSNIEEKEIATENGWFADMENIKIQLENKKQAFQAHLN